MKISAIGPAVSEIKMLWTTDWPRSRDDLDLNYSITHIRSSTQLVICIYHFSGRRLQSFLKKSLVFTFSHVKAPVSKTDLAVKMGQGHARIQRGDRWYGPPPPRNLNILPKKGNFGIFWGWTPLVCCDNI